MQKVVEEDWSFFNQAVRDRATRKLKPPEIPAPLKLVTPDTPPPGQHRAPPGAAPLVEPVPHTTNPVTAPPRPPPISEDRMVRYVLRFLFIVVAAIVLYALFAGAFRLDATRPAIVTGTGSGVVTGTGTGSVTAAGAGGIEAVVTNFTQFNTVPFGDWQVVTGWNFARSGDALPTNQYCYIARDNEGAGKSRFDIENRIASGARLPSKRPDALVPGLTDEVWTQAALKCRWHH